MTDSYLPAPTPPQRGEPLPPVPAEEQVRDQAQTARDAVTDSRQ
jgi:hypothetical protein